MIVRSLVLAVCLAVLATVPGAAQNDPVEISDSPDAAIVDGSAQRALDAARTRWRAHAPVRYRFRVARSCFCPPQVRRSARVVVRGGSPVHPPDRVKDIATVTRLFGKVQAAIDAKVAGLDVRYDPTRGYPRYVYVDESRAIADEEQGYTASELRTVR